MVNADFDIVSQRHTARSVKAVADVFGIQQRKDFVYEIGIQQRFTARKGNAAAVFKIGLIAFNFFCKLFGSVFGACTAPCVGIMAVNAPKRAARKKYAGY